MRRAAALLALSLSFGWLQPTPAHAIGEITMVEVVVVDAPTPRAGDLINVAASVRSEGAPVAGLPVTLQIKRYGEATFEDLITVPTDSEGNLELNLRPLRNIKTRWVFSGDENYAPYSTAARTWLIGSRASLAFSDRTPGVGQVVVVTGRTKPAKPGHTVRVLQGRSNHGGFGPAYPRPELLGTTTVKENGRYRIRVRFTKTGQQPVFVTVSRGNGNTTGYSNTRVVAVG
ncbi:MAG TPA: hypothetical protein VFK41_07325 [Nocardioidaceae bacterium]|nr:hypothetical protein [Nocardioidaceae bacterium]